MQSEQILLTFSGYAEVLGYSGTLGTAEDSSQTYSSGITDDLDSVTVASRRNTQ